MWECATQRELIKDLHSPAGLALTEDASRLVIAERGKSRLLVVETLTGAVVSVFPLNPPPLFPSRFTALSGVAVSQRTGHIYFSDEASHGVYKVVPSSSSSCKVVYNPLFVHSLIVA